MKRYLTIAINAQATTCTLKDGEACPWMRYGSLGLGRTDNGPQRNCGLFRTDLKCKSDSHNSAVLRCSKCREAEGLANPRNVVSLPFKKS